METINKIFPSLYEMSDNYSINSQKTYFYLIFALLSIPIFSALLSYFFEFNFSYKFNLIFRIIAILLFFTIIIVNKKYQKYETLWYESRSLAESIKTIAWKFIMSSGEFFGLSDEFAEKKLKEKLNRIRKSNEHIISLVQLKHNIEVITNEMRNIRNFSLSDKIAFYNKERILEQEQWYTEKAEYNSKRERIYNKISFFIYLIIIVLFVLNIALPNVNFPIDFLVMTAISFTSWSKYKKHNELAISYKLTVHDISFMKEENVKFSSDKEFSDYVTNCENAFSKEHTQWYARKDNLM